MDLKPKRINVFVGKPNVGKSNILEALGLISNISTLNNIIRYKRPSQLFYDNNITEPILVKSNYSSALIARDQHSTFKFIQSNGSEFIDSFLGEGLDGIGKLEEQIREAYQQNINTLEQEQLLITAITINRDGGFSYPYGFPIKLINLLSRVKRYIFNEKVRINESEDELYLKPPFGVNLWRVINDNTEIRKEIGNYFEDYGLEFLMDLTNESFEIQKKIDGVVRKYDYDLIADTLKRMIFHIAAIRSNINSTILFEEPEAHCFPPFIAQMAQEMLDSKTNQFFVATHSPYLLNTIIENGSFDECSINIVSYKDYQTVVRELSEEEVTEMLDYGQDVFINYDAFVE